MQIAVFDLDGVIFKSPAKETINDHGYWYNHWCRPADHVPQQEVLTLMKALVQAGLHILILTARPTQVLGTTLAALQTHCMIRPEVCTNILDHVFEYGKQYHLMMCDLNLHEGDWQGSGVWKHDVIEELKIGYEVLFCVEDYKPSADEIRKSVPVLLYEQLR